MNQNVDDLIDAVEDAMDRLFIDRGRLATEEDKARMAFAVLNAITSFEISEAAK